MKFVYVHCTFASPAICVLPPRYVWEHPVFMICMYTDTHSHRHTFFLSLWGSHSVTLSSLSGQIFLYICVFRELHVGVGRAGRWGERRQAPLLCFNLFLALHTHTHAVRDFVLRLFVFFHLLCLFTLSHCTLLLNSLYSVFVCTNMCTCVCFIYIVCVNNGIL